MVFPNKKLGQHFLTVGTVAEQIILLSGDIERHNVIEIGPGNGILTEAILRKSPLSLVSVEKDSRFLKKHLSLMGAFSNYSILIEDALKTDFVKIVPYPRKIIANIPYNISKFLLRKIIQSSIQNFTSITLMVQREFAIKLMSGSKLGFLLRMHADIKYLFEVDKKCFYPMPKVESAVILITPNLHYESIKHLHRMEMLIEVLFNKKRKVLSSTLKGFFRNSDVLLRELGIDANRRVESLSLKELFAIGTKIEDT